MGTAKLKRHKIQSIDQIPAELFKAEVRKIRYEIHTRVNSIWNKEELIEKWKNVIILRIYKKGDKTDCNNIRGIPLLSTT
jgi:hypothetical protein